MNTWFLVIALISNGGGDIQTIPMWTEESCNAAKNRVVEAMNGYLHAICASRY